MTAENLHPSASETQNPKTPAGEFLYRVFDESKYILQSEKDAKTVAEVRSQFIRRWTNDPMNLNLVKGVILRSERHDYGLVLGVKGFDPEREDKLSFEFGKIAHSGKSYQETLDRWSRNVEEGKLRQEVDYLSTVVHQPISFYGSGRFYVSSGLVEVDCWADLRMFGGNEVGRFPWGGEQTVSGLGDYVDIVRQVANRSWR